MTNHRSANSHKSTGLKQIDNGARDLSIMAIHVVTYGSYTCCYIRELTEWADLCVGMATYTGVTELVLKFAF